MDSADQANGNKTFGDSIDIRTHGLGPAHANPTGPVVKSGTVNFQQSGSILQITNSPNAVIHWQGFSIDRGELTRFIQQNPQSAVLNRVIGASPSAMIFPAFTASFAGAVTSTRRSGVLVSAISTVAPAARITSPLGVVMTPLLPTFGAMRYT